MRAFDDLLSAVVILALCLPTLLALVVLGGLRQHVPVGWILAGCALLVFLMFGFLRWHGSPPREPPA